MKHHIHSSHNNIHMFCSIQTYKYINTSSMKFHINQLRNLAITVYISHITLCLPYICFPYFMLLMTLGFILTGLTLALVAMCHGTRTSSLVSDVVGLYTHWSYTSFAKVPLILGLTFSINDFVSYSCLSFLIPIMITLSYTYASYNFACFSFSFQIHHENINLNSFEII
jgi:lysylphosphatidylglycerol synthetase-like protein (DUF2156 family)